LGPAFARDGQRGGWADTRRVHWRAGIATGFLPPYSPGLNPIEQVFAKLKHLMRKAAGCTVEATWQRIATLLDAFPSHEGAAYFANAEYEQT